MALDLSAMDASAVLHQITLGDLTITVDSFTLEEERPYDLIRLWNGGWVPTPLGRKPCVLSLECRVLKAEQAVLIPLLRAAIVNLTAFSFSLADTAFSGMTVTAFRVKAAEGARFCTVSLTLTGSAEDITT